MTVTPINIGVDQSGGVPKNYGVLKRIDNCRNSFITNLLQMFSISWAARASAKDI